MARERERILAALEKHSVIVVVSDTGSGKTTQLPKMALEAAQKSGATRDHPLAGCTQPRRIAAASVARRVASEMKTNLGDLVGFQVRFQEKISPDTRLKFMTDGILLAETQGDRLLKKYHTLIIDEAHERSLNIDFLLGYLKRLLPRRPDLKVIVSSATLDAGGFSDFFDGCPIVKAEGRTFPVEVEYFPPQEDEDLPSQVGRAVGEIGKYDPLGDILVFLPGEREIRDCTDLLKGRSLSSTDVCPLFARLEWDKQREIFQPIPGRRRIVLATNVAETSLTIPGILYVIDSGLARVSRWNPGRQIQRLQTEPVSQASANQRKGRCGRIAEGLCLRLYDEDDFLARPEFSDPEIRRSSLAGVILQMKSLRLPDISEFPFLDPPRRAHISEGLRTLREIGALDQEKKLTPVGKSLARLPVEPRLGRMLLAAAEQNCLGPVRVIVSGLTVMDPRERPAEKQEEADRAHAAWADEDSDFFSLLHLWDALSEFREKNKWRRNQLRKFCKAKFLNYRRVLEWDNLQRELERAGRQNLKWKSAASPGSGGKSIASAAEYQSVHEAILTGVPRQFGMLDPASKEYKPAGGGGKFAIFPGSGLFGRKKPGWLLAFEMVDTTRLWARRVAKIDPEWVENVAPHLCRSRFHSACWNKKQGAVYAKEIVTCGGLPVIEDRRVHFGRIDPNGAREVFVRDGILGGGLVKEPAFLHRIAQLRKEVRLMEDKLRRTGGLWQDDAVFQFLEKRIPSEMCTAKAFHRWLGQEDHAELLIPSLHDLIWEDPARLDLDDFPDCFEHDGETYPLHYRHAPGEYDDGVTMEVALSQLHGAPIWLPSWGVRGDLGERVACLIRSLPKAKRVPCQPVAAAAEDFVEQWHGWEPQCDLHSALAEFLSDRTGLEIAPDDIDDSKLPDYLITKIWIYDDESGEEIATGTSLAVLQEELQQRVEEHFDRSFGSDWEMSGQLDWQKIGDLPESVSAGGRTAYPALTDEGESAGVKLWLDEDQAHQSHRLGCGRLFLLRCPDLKKHLEKNPPMELDTRMTLPMLGRGGVTLDSFALLAAEGAFRDVGPLPRSSAEFARAAKAARGEFYDQGTRLGKCLDGIVARYRKISIFLEEHRGDRNLGESVADIERQIDWLLRENFLLEAGLERIESYGRYFRAIDERIERLRSQPLVRDLEKMDRVTPLREKWEWLCGEEPGNAAVREIGYELEELRVNLFASGVPGKKKVSEKRIAEKLGASD